ncbi:MAG: TolC family protein [Ginsengibacter sp.]
MIPGSWRKLCMLALLMPVLPYFSAFSQNDTVKISVAEGEKIFLQNNLSILAAKYNIDANRALIRQARFWDNPVISTDQNIYDSQGGYFKHDQTNGQVYVQVMQLIRTAGKRTKLAQLAEDNTTISTGQFDDLLRTLRYALITDLYEIEHQLKIKRVYDAEINEVQTLVAAMDEQLQSGNISVKDNIRIKALLFSLKNELVNVDAQLMPLQNEVKLLLRNSDSSFILPVFNYYLPDLIKKEIPSKEELVKIAEDNRPDIKIASSQLDYANHNFTYQKALAKPDISIGTEYDQRSSYAPNYVGLAISFPLNILNRNQGNIASARFNIKQQQALYDGQLSKIGNDISSAVAKIKFYQQVNNLQQLDFAQQYESVFQNMLKSYQQRQVSLLEFIDFADAYKDTRLKILEQHTSLIKALEELNYQAGKDVISLNK